MLEYVVLVLRLLQDESFRHQQAQRIEDAYYHRFNKNRQVAEEWMSAIRRILASIY